MKISVIIPTYKPMSYLWECLDSLAAQTFHKNEFEVVLVLNGCRDPYEDDIKKYIAGHPELNINFFQTDQGGVSNARNMALDIAKGEYITFIDDDDYVSENYLEELYCKVNRDVVTLARPVAFDDITGQVLNKYPIEMEFFRRKCNKKQAYYKAKKFFSGACMKLIHKDIIGHRRFNPAFKNGEDSLFMFLVSDRMKFVDFTSAQAIYYRRIRLNSAISNNRSFLYRLKNSSRMIIEYIKIYYSNYINYNEWFLFTRILGALKSIINFK